MRYVRIFALFVACLLTAAASLLLPGCDGASPAPDGTDTDRSTAPPPEAKTDGEAPTEKPSEETAEESAEKSTDREALTEEATEEVTEASSAAPTLCVMSWNLQCPSAEDTDLFAAMRDGITYYDADIIGLQECNKAAHRGGVSRFRSLYSVATAYHEGTETYDYTPILYKTERFDLLESGVEWLDGRYTGTNTKCLSWAVLSDKENGGQKLIMLNFHGAVASNKYKGMEDMTGEELAALATEWKIDNIHQIHRKIAALEKEYGELPVFVTGDYNTSLGAEPYKVMESYGYLDAEFTAVTSAMTGTKSTHTMGQRPAAGKSIDHIFYSPDRGITPYVHCFGMRQSDLDATDHLPLLVDFAITP